MAQGNRIKIFQGRDPHTKFSANPLSLYHNEGCSYSYSSVRGVIQDVFLYHFSITALSLTIPCLPSLQITRLFYAKTGVK